MLPPTAPDADTTCRTLAAAADSVLAQCEQFIRAVPDDVFAGDSALIRGGTLGKHLRHVLDHFAAILWADELDGPIAYDRRERNVAMESDRALAAEAVRSLRTKLGPCAARPCGERVEVRIMVAESGLEVDLASTLGRELAFATHHAVHHAAMMKAIASEFGVTAETAFGKAPSTLLYEHASSSKAVSPDQDTLAPCQTPLHAHTSAAAV